MKNRYYIAIGLTIVVLQSYFGQMLEINGIVPDIVLVYLVFVGLFNGSRTALGVAIAAGLYADIFLGAYIGEYTLFYILSSYLTGIYRHNFYYSNIQIPLLLVSLITFLKFIFAILLRVVFYSVIGPVNLMIILGTIVYNLVLSAAFYWLFIRKWTGFENER